MYRPQLKVNKQYPPLFKIKIPCDSKNNPCCTIFDIHKNILEFNSIDKHLDVSAVIELTGVYFIAKEFGVSWKLLQLMILQFLQLVILQFLQQLVTFGYQIKKILVF